MQKRILTILGILLILGVVGALVYPWVSRRLSRSAQQSQYQTTPAKRGDLTAFVGATGTVRSNQSAKVAWQTSGKIASVAGQKGQVVKAGDVLASLDPTSLAQTIIMAQGDLVTAQKNLDSVMDNTSARANAHLALVQAQQALDDAQKNSQSAQFQRAGQNTIDISRANLVQAEDAVNKAQEIFDRNSGRSQDDPQYAAALSQLANAKQKRDTAKYNLQYVQGLPDPLSVEQVNAKLEQAQANLLAAKNEWDRIKDGPDPRDIAAAQAKVDSAQATVNLARLTAPFNGVLTLVDAQPGDQVGVGTLAFEIDDLSKLLVDVQVSEVDINRVQTGQPVDLTFDAVPNKTYSGVVTEIGTIGSSVSGSVNFTVTVQILNGDAEIKPGMTTAANIAVSQLQDVSLVPNRAVRVVNNKRVVYVLRNNFPTPVEVTLGPSDNNNSQMLSGDLKPGDLIILNPPAQPLRPGAGGGMGAIFGGSGSRSGSNTQSGQQPSNSSGGGQPNSGAGGSGGSQGGQP